MSVEKKKENSDQNVIYIVIYECRDQNKSATVTDFLYVTDVSQYH